MKQIVIVIWLCLWTLVPGFAQKQMDTVRAALIGVNNPEKLVFTLDDGGDTLKVRLGGKLKKIAPEFYALDVRSGDTLTVVGIRKAGNRSNTYFCFRRPALVTGDKTGRCGTSRQMNS